MKYGHTIDSDFWSAFVAIFFFIAVPKFGNRFVSIGRYFIFILQFECVFFSAEYSILFCFGRDDASRFRINQSTPISDSMLSTTNSLRIYWKGSKSHSGVKEKESQLRQQRRKKTKHFRINDTNEWTKRNDEDDNVDGGGGGDRDDNDVSDMHCLISISTLSVTRLIISGVSHQICLDLILSDRFSTHLSAQDGHGGGCGPNRTAVC